MQNFVANLHSTTRAIQRDNCGEGANGRYGSRSTSRCCAEYARCTAEKCTPLIGCGPESPNGAAAFARNLDHASIYDASIDRNVVPARVA